LLDEPLGVLAADGDRKDLLLSGVKGVTLALSGRERSAVMRRSRFRHLLVVGAAVVLLVLPTGAAAQTTYNLSGVEVNANPATFVGVLVGQPGTWQAVVQHGTLNKTPGGITLITGGAFSISPLGASTITGIIVSGQLQAGPMGGSFFCTQSFAVSGLLTSGSFGGVLMHFGIRSGTSCNALFATFTGVATFS
jgi:hypothetical protein